MITLRATSFPVRGDRPGDRRDDDSRRDVPFFLTAKLPRAGGVAGEALSRSERGEPPGECGVVFMRADLGKLGDIAGETRVNSSGNAETTVIFQAVAPSLGEMVREDA